MEPFIEKLPTAVGDKLKGATVAEEEVLIQVATDMAGRERFDQRWLVVTDRQVLFLHANGGDGTIHLPMAEVKTARVEALVGGGYLEVERQVGDPIYLYYSNSLAPKFAEVAEGIKQLKQGDDLTLPTQVERTHCERCRRLLPENRVSVYVVLLQLGINAAGADSGAAYYSWLQLDLGAHGVVLATLVGQSGRACRLTLTNPFAVFASSRPSPRSAAKACVLIGTTASCARSASVPSAPGSCFSW